MNVKKTEKICKATIEIELDEVNRIIDALEMFVADERAERKNVADGDLKFWDDKIKRDDAMADEWRSLRQAIK